MNIPFRPAALSILLLAAAAPAPVSRAADPVPPKLPENAADGEKAQPKFGTVGPTVGDLGEGEVKVPAKFRFLNKAETQMISRANGDRVSGRERGAVLPAAGGDESWISYFAFDPVGYVKDDDKNAIDADALLENYQESAKAQNAENPGHPPITVVGWREKPHYNETTHNLEWCIEAKVGSAPLINHKIKLLGRHGVMEVVVACNPAQLPSALADTRALLANYAFKSGGKYEEWTTGDKVAAYGLTGLVAGGAIAAAAKTGLLGKLIKPILVGLAALGGAIVKFWNKLTGRNK